MPTLLERGLRWIRDKLPDAAAITISLRASGEVIGTLNAVPARRRFAQYAVDEYVGTSEDFDWIVAEQDLVFDGVKREPQDGWELWVTLEGRYAVFVARPGQGTRVYDVADQLGLLYRIHTKLDRFEQA